MPAKKRPNPLTQETVYRVFYLDESTIELVKQVREKRGQTMREFCQEAVEGEAQRLTKALLDLGIQSTTAGTRPVRLPLSDSLLETLHECRDLTDLPMSTFLAVCLRRSAARKRRRKSPSKKGTDK